MSKKTLKYISYFIIFTLIIALDQISKYFAFKYLQPIGTYPLIQDILHLQYRQNTGAAFSILSGHTTFFIVITGIVLVLMAYVILSNKITNVLAEYMLVLITAGGTGNWIDRISRNFVVDMFDFAFMDFAVFNVADIFITCGSFIFIIIFIFSKGEVIKWE